MRIQVKKDTCVELEKSSRLEWLETNGLGSFSCGTASGLHTRRYHGLLTAALDVPVKRTLLVSKFEETLWVDGTPHELSTNRYPGSVHPRGFEYLREFRLDPFPTWIFEVGVAVLEKRLFMVHGEDTVVVEYVLKSSPAPCQLELRPLIAFRNHHFTTHANPYLSAAIEAEGEVVSIQPYADLPRVFFSSNANAVEKTGYWYYKFQYAEERLRGLDYEEDLFQPFALGFELPLGGAASVTVSRDKVAPVGSIPELRLREIQRRHDLRLTSPAGDMLAEDLAEAADQFIAKRGDGETIIAGYPWFTDWGRDTMISLPGLLLCTGRFNVARCVLLEYAGVMSEGMLPNRFPDGGEEPEYNTVDATLWFFEAVRSFLRYTQDYAFVQEQIYPKLLESIDYHLTGTRYGIRTCSDGLLRAGEEGVQLTWMDAKIGNWVVTPRRGKPVEVQALWYNALCVMQELAIHYGERKRAVLLQEQAEKAKASFNEQFWNADTGCLFDVVDGARRDASIRPNQIFAISLHHTMLDREKEKSILKVVEEHLLTPAGLRSLSPIDPAYRGRYGGGVLDRDSAYHQGTVWTWLMGPFLTAYCKVYPESSQPRQWLEGFSSQIRERCLGQVAEIADGDFPHVLRGCFAQAWSVAELLRAASENIYRHRGPTARTATSKRMSTVYV